MATCAPTSELLAILKKRHLSREIDRGLWRRVALFTLERLERETLQLLLRLVWLLGTCVKHFSPFLAPDFVRIPTLPTS